MRYTCNARLSDAPQRRATHDLFAWPFLLSVLLLVISAIHAFLVMRAADDMARTIDSLQRALSNMPELVPVPKKCSCWPTCVCCQCEESGKVDNRY